MESRLCMWGVRVDSGVVGGDDDLGGDEDLGVAYEGFAPVPEGFAPCGEGDGCGTPTAPLPGGGLISLWIPDCAIDDLVCYQDCPWDCLAIQLFWTGIPDLSVGKVFPWRERERERWVAVELCTREFAEKSLLDDISELLSLSGRNIMLTVISDYKCHWQTHAPHMLYVTQHWVNDCCDMNTKVAVLVKQSYSNKVHAIFQFTFHSLTI